MTTILPYDTESALHLIRLAVAAGVYVRRDVTFEYEGILYAVGTKLRNLTDRRKKLSDSVLQQLEEIEKLNAALKPKTIAQMRLESQAQAQAQTQAKQGQMQKESETSEPQDSAGAGAGAGAAAVRLPVRRWHRNVRPRHEHEREALAMR